MNARLSAAVAALGIAVAVVPAHAGSAPAAAVAPAQITDPSGDANGINDQGAGLGQDGNTATPADDSNADITSVAFATTFKTVTTIKTVTVVVKKKKVTKKVTVTTKVPDGFTV